MDDERFKKRINETMIEMFALDRILPLETVYSFFIGQYNQVNGKGVFFRDRKFQRLREGYFALFAALTFNDTQKKPYYLYFPSDASNDVNIGFPKINTETKCEFEAYPFDIKEFTEFSQSFQEFVDKSVAPKINIYNLIIVTYRYMNGKDLEYLVDYLKNHAPDTKVWLTGASTKDHDYVDTARVTIVDSSGILYNKDINLNEWLDKNKPPIVYQDVVRLK